MRHHWYDDEWQEIIPNPLPDSYFEFWDREIDLGAQTQEAQETIGFVRGRVGVRDLGG